MGLGIEIDTPQEGVRNITLRGRLDTNTTPQLDEVLSGMLGGRLWSVVFDLAHLEYISSAGLRAIFRTEKELSKNRGAACVVNLQPQVEKVFTIVKAMPINSVFKSWDEVDVYLDKIQRKMLELAD